MTKQNRRHDLSRRGLIAAATAGAVMAPALLRAQTAPATPATATPLSVVTSPPRDFSPRGAPSVYGRDPDIITIDPAFDALTQGNAPIQRLWTGSLWAEGPAWSSVGRFMVWSDIPNNRQLRWIEDDGRVSVFRTPSNNSNGIPSTSRAGRSPAST